MEYSYSGKRVTALQKGLSYTIISTRGLANISRRFLWQEQHAGRGDLFEGLSIWQEQRYRELQGTYPVISLSFARVKENTYIATERRSCEILRDLYIQHYYLQGRMC